MQIRISLFGSPKMTDCLPQAEKCHPYKTKMYEKSVGRTMWKMGCTETALTLQVGLDGDGEVGGSPENLKSLVVVHLLKLLPIHLQDLHTHTQSNAHLCQLAR